MKITLVNPPRSSYDISELSPPLGLLRLGTGARHVGADVSIVDFNLLWHTDEKLQSNYFYQSALDLLLEKDSDIYGFTSMAVDSHVCLRLAEALKKEKPNAVTVFGGTHFSSIAPRLLSDFPWVDVVIQGEGEDSFKDLIKQLAKKNAKAPSAETRSRIIPFTRGVNDEGSSALQFPDYSLVDLQTYFELNTQRICDFEGGRGCRFKCAFCYSPVHYGRVQHFEIDKRIEELRLLRNLGVEHVSFVEDNFLNDISIAIQFCRELETARLGLTWNCYATFPQMNTDVITWMARAGCTSVFTGIDAVGMTSQRSFRKGFLRSFTALETKLNECMEAGILPTCAFMLSPPSHPCGVDTEEVLKAALGARNCGAMVRLNTLTLYNGTASQSSVSAQLVADNLRPRLLLDVPDVVETNAYADKFPELFPFHSRYVPKREWKDFMQVIHCLFTLYFCYPETLESLWEEKNITPIHIAKSVIETLGDLTTIDKLDRRGKELETAAIFLKGLSVSSNICGPLEAESAALGISL
ncbi:MAG TPA: cobalamin-dependent protein [Pyrinomonadaceae bacterium]|jgi:hypothetical protein